MKDKSIAEPWRACKLAVEALRHKITPAEYSIVVDFIDHNECGLSIEFLIDYLVDRESSITRAEFNFIYDAMLAMGLENTSRLESVRSLIEAAKNNLPTT